MPLHIAPAVIDPTPDERLKLLEVENGVARRHLAEEWHHRLEEELAQNQVHFDDPLPSSITAERRGHKVLLHTKDFCMKYKVGSVSVVRGLYAK